MFDLEKLRELSKKGTTGKWIISGNPEEDCVECVIALKDGGTMKYNFYLEDVELSCFLHNSIPLILKELEAGRELVKSMRKIDCEDLDLEKAKSEANPVMRAMMQGACSCVNEQNTRWRYQRDSALSEWENSVK
jgi:hypothetical protein